VRINKLEAKIAKQLYELHVYTMGSRSYATEIIKRIDPERKYFADRRISREDSGGPHNRKDLRRIFPCDDRTVLIIDDRADVWDYSRNLVQVPPFYFFIGTGDVNARPGMVQHVLPDVKVPVSVEYEVTMSRFVREPDHALEEIYLVLEEAHRTFFRQMDGGEAMPDIKIIMDDLKRSVLGETGIVFSSLAPMQSRIQDSHLWRMAEQYGSVCDMELNDRTTHVVSYRCDTSKVLCAVQRGLHVVTPDWLLQSVFSWDRLPEKKFKPSGLPTVTSETVLDNAEPLGTMALDEYTREIDKMLAEESSDENSNDSHGPPSLGQKRRRNSGDSDDLQDLDDAKEVSDFSVNFDSDDFACELETSLDTARPNTTN